MGKIAFILSHLIDLENLFETKTSTIVNTQFGAATIIQIIDTQGDFFILHRSVVPTMPHLVNYRANLCALKEIGVNKIIGTAMVGAINKKFHIGDIILVDQFIDFTNSRPKTIFPINSFRFTDMSEPYCKDIKNVVLSISKSINIKIEDKACYVGVDGPRFETSAEIRMFEKLGGDLVGMSNIPEIVFARELGMCYSALALVTNMAAGISAEQVSIDEINAIAKLRSNEIKKLLLEVINRKSLLDKNCNHCFNG